MPLGAQVWTLDWMTLHPGQHYRDTNGVQWLLIEEKGFWGSPGPDVQTTHLLNRHGVYRPPGWKKGRTITLTGRLYAEDFTVLRQAEAQVLGLLQDPSIPGVLTCYSEFGALQCQVFLDDDILCTPLEVISEPGIEFSIQLLAPDPRKYSPGWNMLSTNLQSDNGDGLNFEAASPDDDMPGLDFGQSDENGLVFGTSNSGGQVVITNAGTAPTMPVFGLRGPLDHPTITAPDQGGALTYGDVIADGQRLVIDPSIPSVRLHTSDSDIEGDDRRPWATLGAYNQFTVPPADPVTGQPGQLKVAFYHQGPNSGTEVAAGTLDVSYRYAWW